jgi:hypothetical protein
MGMLQDFKAQDFSRKHVRYPSMERKKNWTIFDEVIKITSGAGSRSRSGTLMPDPDPVQLFRGSDRHDQKVPDPARSGSGSTTPAFMTNVMMGPLCPGYYRISHHQLKLSCDTVNDL